MSTQNMFLPTAEMSRNPNRAVEDLYNAELVARIFEDGVIASDKFTEAPTSVYIAAVSQAGVAAPVLTEILNTTGATVAPAFVGGGDYTLTFSLPVLTQGQTFISLHQPSVTNLAEVVKACWTSTTVINLLSGSSGAVAANSIITSAILTVEIYD